MNTIGQLSERFGRFSHKSQGHSGGEVFLWHNRLKSTNLLVELDTRGKIIQLDVGPLNNVSYLGERAGIDEGTLDEIDRLYNGPDHDPAVSSDISNIRSRCLSIDGLEPQDVSGHISGVMFLPVWSKQSDGGYAHVTAGPEPNNFLLTTEVGPLNDRQRGQVTLNNPDQVVDHVRDAIHQSGRYL